MEFLKTNILLEFLSFPFNCQYQRTVIDGRLNFCQILSEGKCTNKCWNQVSIAPFIISTDICCQHEPHNHTFATTYLINTETSLSIIGLCGILVLAYNLWHYQLSRSNYNYRYKCYVYRWYLCCYFLLNCSKFYLIPVCIIASVVKMVQTARSFIKKRCIKLLYKTKWWN